MFSNLMRLFLLLPLPPQFILWTGTVEWIYNLVTPKIEPFPLPPGHTIFPVRVNDEYPVRNLGRLDWERCAALHNVIVQAGWELSGRNISDLVAPSWWSNWGDDEIAQSGRLDNSLVKFLQLAMDEPLNHNASSGWNFHRMVRSFAAPNLLFDNVNFDEDGDDDRYVLLYLSSSAVASGHDQGLIYDQRENLAIFQAVMEDTDMTMTGGARWVPLEIILEGWIQMIEQYKVFPSATKPKPASNALDDVREQEWTEPWSMPSNTVMDVMGALIWFDGLIQAIEDRMPPGSLTSEEIEYGFLNGNETGDGDSTKTVLANDFARKFLRRARKPRFQYIAPGLEFNPTTIKQPFENEEPQWGDDYIRPVLLASGLGDASEDKHDYGTFNMSDVPFRGAFPKPLSFPSGLYLTEIYPAGDCPYEDGVRLILPYQIGLNGWARKGDGSYLSQDSRFPFGDVPRNTSQGLYQSGYNPWAPTHDVQLKFILSKWTWMVEQGHWDVDEHGVAGGIEKWHDADTEEHWSDYNVGMHW